MTANSFARDVFREFPLVPDLDVVERPGRVTVQVALAGVKPEEVSVAATDTVLTIKGERTLEHPKRIYRFTRSTRLPNGVRATEVTTDFHDGVLTVTVPLTESPALNT
jgi:HSP20 family molecular chaperone IbpA